MVRLSNEIRRSGLAATGLLAMILVGSGLHAAELRLDAQVFIEVQADGKNCRIRKVKVPCADAIAYLRDTLKLPPGTGVGVKADQTAPFKDVKKVLDDVQNSEFLHPVAYLAAAEEDRGK